MRWAVLGDGGMFGAEQKNLLQSLGQRTHGFNRQNFNAYSSVDDLAKCLDGFDTIVNGIAYTDVDRAESDTDLAMELNGYFVGRLASAAEKIGARFIHLSTDYVFDGQLARAYKPSDSPSPVNAYGRSKLLGENLVADSAADYSIVRTAWLYGKYRKSFPSLIAEHLQKNGFVRVVSDEFGQPTWAADVANQVIRLSMLDSLPRIFHATSSGVASRFDQACAVAKSLGMHESSVIPIPSQDFPAIATRPKYSALSSVGQSIAEIGDWRDRWRAASSQVLAGQLL